MTIRGAALLACVTCLISLVLPACNAARQIASPITGQMPSWFGPIAVAVFLVLVSVPLFYFALYRNPGTLRLSLPVRRLSLAVALTLSLRAAVQLPHWIGSLGHHDSASVLAPTPYQWTADFTAIANLLAAASHILLLVILYRNGNREADLQTPVSPFLRWSTRLALVLGGCWVTFHLCRLALTPYTYAALRDFALRMGQAPPPYRDVVSEAAGMLLSQAGIFAAPFVVWRGMGERPS